MTTPRLTNSVLRGIIAATAQVLSGPEEGECEGDWANIERANVWAHATRDRRAARARKRKAKVAS